MLLGCPGQAELFEKTLGLQTDGSLSEDHDAILPTRTLSFLVGRYSRDPFLFLILWIVRIDLVGFGFRGAREKRSVGSRRSMVSVAGWSRSGGGSAGSDQNSNSNDESSNRD